MLRHNKLARTIIVSFAERKKENEQNIVERKSRHGDHVSPNKPETDSEAVGSRTAICHSDQGSGTKACEKERKMGRR